MAIVGEFWRRIAFLCSRRRFDADLEAEMQFHLEMTANERREAGMPAEEAALAARRQFGSPTRLKESSVEAWGWSAIEQCWRDLRLAVRTLGRSPGFVVVAIVTLAVGIGANTAIFSVVHTVLYKPLPFDHPETLVSIRHAAPQGPLRRQSAATYLTYRDERRAFEDVGMWNTSTAAVTGVAEPERVDAMRVTDGVLPVLRVQPVLGRRFTAEDDSPASPVRVMLSHGFWQRKFGGDRGVIGRSLTIDGEPREIIGVLPAGFRMPGSNPALLLPFRIDRAAVRIGNFGNRAVARLKPGVTIEEANRDLARMIPLVIEKFALPSGITRTQYDADFRLGPDVRPLANEVVGNVGPVLWTLVGAIGMVLLIACANVANLFLVRAEGRQHELAVRAALGAGRLRIARELLSESLVLGAAAGMVGVALAMAGIRLLVALAPDGLPRLDEIAVDPMALAFTAIVSILSSVLFGLLPALRFSAPPVEALKDGARETSGGRGRHRARRLLVASEVALSLVLLVGCGLMMRTFVALRSVDPGVVRPDEVLTFRITVPPAEAPDDERSVRTHEQIVRRLEQVPGVESVGLSSSVTMDGYSQYDAILVERFPGRPGQQNPARRFKWASERYFETLGIPIVAGRGLTWADCYSRAAVVVVNEALAREYWPTPAAAIGQRIRESPENPWREIVGVVGNERDDGLESEAPATVYMPLLNANWWDMAPFTQRSLGYAVRTSTVGSPSLLRQVQRAVWSVNPNLPIARVRSLDDIRALTMAQTTFTLVMLVLAAGVALLLGTVGLYGVISYVVAGDTREIGIRVALGARPGQVRGRFVRQGLSLACVGMVAGLVAAGSLTRLLEAMLFGVSPLDPATYAAVCALLGAVALAASYLPARRASRVDAVTALRS